jgi:hypothetical protein
LRNILGLILVGIMRTPVRRFTLLISLLICFASAAEAIAQQGKAANPDGETSFHTLDGDLQQVNVEEIWRVRESTGVDEPTGAIVIDYAFERLYVKDRLENVVNTIRSQRKIEKFTSPSGAPIYITPEKVIGISRALPLQHHQNSKSIIIAREGQQQVQESREAVRAALGK